MILSSFDDAFPHKRPAIDENRKIKNKSILFTGSRILNCFQNSLNLQYAKLTNFVSFINYIFYLITDVDDDLSGAGLQLAQG